MKKFLAAFLGMLILTGCASLPTKVDIKSGPELVAPEAVDFSYYVPNGPTANASAQEIVSGFLAAGTGPQNDYSVAREFLTAEFAQRWNPEAEVLVRTGIPEFQPGAEALQIVNVDVAARVDEHGRYVETAGPTSTSLRFQLQKQDGQWRISNAPNLTVVTAPVFSVVFNGFSVYFYNNTQTGLVSDLRWFPSRASTGTKLVNALLAGPSEHLASGVTTAIPKGTKLTIDAVNVENGVALVDFDGTALQADAKQRGLLLAQLRATLLQLVGVSDVRVSINSSAQEITPAELKSAAVGGGVFYLKETGVYSLNGASDAPLRGTPSLLSSTQVQKFDVMGDGEWMAYATGEGVRLVESAGISIRSSLVTRQSSVRSLFFDSFGYLWVVPISADNPIEVISTSGERKFLFDNLSIERGEIKISPAGARLAVVDETSEVSRVITQSVLRDRAGWPIRIVPGGQVNPVFGTVISLTWQSSDTVRILEGTPSGVTTLTDYAVTGPRFPLSTPPVRGVDVTTGTAGLTTYLISDSGEIWALTGTSWRRVATGVTLIAAND